MLLCPSSFWERNRAGRLVPDKRFYRHVEIRPNLTCPVTRLIRVYRVLAARGVPLALFLI
jgi:hypothetical protein